MKVQPSDAALDESSNFFGHFRLIHLFDAGW
jgi:hypothetical protein